MNIRSFKEFENYMSGDEKSVINKVHIITSGEISENSPFSVIPNLEEADGLPVLMCGNFKLKMINESNVNNLKIYNSFNIKKTNVLNKFIGENFIPKTIKNRTKVKSLKFPIVASGKNGTNTYNSYHMFKKSENDYNSYQEKIIPKTKYNVLMFKNEPICMYEKVNDKTFHKNISEKLRSKASSISKRIFESHGLEVYNMRIYESTGGNYYLSGISKCDSLNEHQAGLLYVKLYEDHYDYKVPTWFKNKVNSIDVNS
jgi:hypothetical protein